MLMLTDCDDRNKASGYHIQGLLTREKRRKVEWVII